MIFQNRYNQTAVEIFQRLFVFITWCYFCLGSAFGQRTVGLLHADFQLSNTGFDLLYPNNQSTVFLNDQCGRIVHTWLDDAKWRPGNVAYLLENGNLLRAKRNFASINDPIWFSGGGEVVELVSWEGEILWQFSQNDSVKRLHHDIQPMPNGHILLVSWELKTRLEAIEYGRDPATLLEHRLFPDYILEVSPEHGDSVFWEWHAWDHMIQEFDNSKPNFGSVKEHPELIDLNYDTRNGIPDWLHINSIDYNPDLDQIMVSVLGFDEIWIIDHSTTMEEAASSSGGLGGRGGDLLFRWGNPQAYRQGIEDDRQLFGQHDAHWILEVPSESPYFGQIAVFNNEYRPDFSAAHIIKPVFDTTARYYDTTDGRFLPETYALTLTHPQPTSFRSMSVSSFQLLSNGNFLLCAGQIGYTIELDPLGEIVWEYILPLRSGFPVSQGEVLKLNDNFIFRHKRYPLDFPGFDLRNLEPGLYLELNPDSTLCNLITSVNERNLNFHLKIFPNPGSNSVKIELPHGSLNGASIYNLQGESIFSVQTDKHEIELDVMSWVSGLYFLKLPGYPVRKIVVNH